MIINTNNPKSDYKEFLQTDFWWNLRTACLKRDEYKCQRCHSLNNLQAHHNFYRDDWFETRVEDLTTLCKLCHEQHHGHKSKPKMSGLSKRVMKERARWKRKKKMERIKNWKYGR